MASITSASPNTSVLLPIAPETLNAIHRHIDIVEVVGEHVTFDSKRSTKRDLWACCPFHLEKTPSFKVDTQHGFFKCFGGCDAKGDAITFLRKKLGYSYMEAMEAMARKYGIPWEPSNGDEAHATAARTRDGHYLLLVQAQAYYSQQLTTPAGKKAATHLQARGITPSLIATFGIGYSPHSWRAWHDEALKQGYTLAQLLATGMVVQKEGDAQPYDRFRGRLMFPIYDLTGKVIGFGARQLHHEDRGPKYLNSPETTLYQKGKSLYGLYQARQAIRDSGHAYLAEGYTDVIALHHAGLPQAVASSGTSLTPEQLHLLARFTKNVTILFDGDLAGTHATDRSIDLLLDQGFDIKVVRLPDGQDPASHLQQQGAAALRHYLETTARDFITYLIERLLHDTADDPSKRSHGIRAILARIARIPDAIKQNVYLSLCARLLNLEMQLLSSQLKSLAQEASLQPTGKRYNAQPPAPHGKEKQERDLLHLLLVHGMQPVTEEKRLGDYLLKELEDLTLTTPDLQGVLIAFKASWQQEEGIDTKAFLQAQPATLQATLIDILAPPPHMPSPTWYTRHQIPLPQATDKLLERSYRGVQRLKLRMVQQLLAENREKMRTTTHQEEALDEAISIHTALQALQKEIATTLGIVLWSHHQTPIIP